MSFPFHGTDLSPIERRIPIAQLSRAERSLGQGPGRPRSGGDWQRGRGQDELSERSSEWGNTDGGPLPADEVLVPAAETDDAAGGTRNLVLHPALLVRMAFPRRECRTVPTEPELLAGTRAGPR